MTMEALSRACLIQFFLSLLKRIFYKMCYFSDPEHSDGSRQDKSQRFLNGTPNLSTAARAVLSRTKPPGVEHAHCVSETNAEHGDRVFATSKRLAGSVSLEVVEAVEITHSQKGIASNYIILLSGLSRDPLEAFRLGCSACPLAVPFRTS